MIFAYCLRLRVIGMIVVVACLIIPFCTLHGLTEGARLAEARRLAIERLDSGMTFARVLVSWSGYVGGWSEEGSSPVGSLTASSRFLQL